MAYHPEEFIGLEMCVEKSRNKSQEKIKGKIIDESRNTFIIKTNNQKTKTILKQGSVFIINNKQVNGDEITKKPEERIKNK